MTGWNFSPFGAAPPGNTQSGAHGRGRVGTELWTSGQGPLSALPRAGFPCAVWGTSAGALRPTGSCAPGATFEPEPALRAAGTHLPVVSIGLNENPLEAGLDVLHVLVVLPRRGAGGGGERAGTPSHRGDPAGPCHQGHTDRLPWEPQGPPSTEPSPAPGRGWGEMCSFPLCPSPSHI